MAYESNITTLIGNLTDDPTLRFTPGGTPVCNLRVASTKKWTDKDGRQQEDTTFMDVTVWRDQAENVAETLHKGDRAIVIGSIKNRSYEKDGQTRWVTEIEADEVAPSLRWARASLTKGGGSNASAGSAADDDDVPF